MILVKLPDGAIDAATRGVLLTPPFDLDLAAAPMPATAFSWSIAADAGHVGVAVSVTVTPDGVFTGTIALAAAGGVFVPPVLTFAGTATAQTALFTPGQAGTLLLTASAGGDLADPSPLTFVAAAVSLRDLQSLVPLVGPLTLAGSTWVYVPVRGRYRVTADAMTLALAATDLPESALVVTLGVGIYTATVVRRPGRPPLVAFGPYPPPVA